MTASRSDRTRRDLSQPPPDSDIQVWCASLERLPQELAGLFCLLSTDEKARADRFYFERDRNRFIAARGLLRTILGSYLEMKPSQMEFVYGQHGKPALRSAPRKKVPEFNLSHSKDLAVYIFSWDCKVGIDVEYVHALPDMDNFAEQFFSAREHALINSLKGEQKEDTFFKLWTCKEALLKAHGSGLTTPLSQVEILLESEGPAILSPTWEDKDLAKPWRLETWNPVVGYQAACAIEGHAGQVTFQQLATQP